MYHYRVQFLGSMMAAMAVVIAWAGWIGWRKWPEWQAVREMREAVERKEPAPFVTHVSQVESLGVCEAAADEIAPLRHHPDPRVRMYAIVACTVLGPRGPAEAKELIELFDDPNEDIAVRRTAAPCLVLCGEHARAAVPSLIKAVQDFDHPLKGAAIDACLQLGQDVTGPFPPKNHILGRWPPKPPEANGTARTLAIFVLIEAREVFDDGEGGQIW